MKKIISVAAAIAVFGGVFTTDIAFAKTSQNDFYQHSMANRQRQAEQRDRAKHQHWYEMQRRAREQQRQRNPLEEYYNQQQNKRQAKPALNAPEFAQQVLKLCNAERAKAGAAPLQLSQDLQDVTDIRAKELVRYFSHTRPDGSSCFTVLNDRKHYLAENIAAGQEAPESVVDSWMNSDGHRKNILNPRYRELGVGYCYEENSEFGYYWVQMFRGN